MPRGLQVAEGPQLVEGVLVAALLYLAFHNVTGSPRLAWLGVLLILQGNIIIAKMLSNFHPGAFGFLFYAGFLALVTTSHRPGRALWQDGIYFTAMVGILVFANWGKPGENDGGVWAGIYAVKWIVTGVFGVALAGSIFAWFRKEELDSWVDSSWTFAKQILPLL